MKKFLINLMLISSSVVGMNYDSHASDDLSKGLKRKNVEQIELDSIKKQRNSLEEDSDYVKTRDIVLSIINPDYTRVDGQKINIKEWDRRNISVYINKWKKLGEAKQEEIIDIVKKGKTCSGLGTINLRTGRKLDINIIVNMLQAKKGNMSKFLQGKDKDKNLQRVYFSYVKFWEVLAKEEVKLSSKNTNVDNIICEEFSLIDSENAKVDNVICEEFSLVDSDSDYLKEDISDEENDEQFELKEDLSIGNFKSKKEIFSLEINESHYNIVNAIINEKNSNEICKYLDISKNTYYKYKSLINLWYKLPRNNRLDIIESVTQGVQRKTDLGVYVTESGKEYDLDLIVNLMKHPKDVSKDKLEYRYKEFARVWKILAEKRWDPSEGDWGNVKTQNGMLTINKRDPSEGDWGNIKTQNGILTINKWDPSKLDSEYVMTRDLVRSIIESDYTKSDTANVSVCINKWRELGTAKQEEIIKAVNSDESYSGLGFVKQKTGKNLDIDTIVNMLKTKKGRRSRCIKRSEKCLTRVYQNYVRIWEVLSREKIKLSPDRNTKDSDYIKIRDEVFTCFDSRYRDAEGKKVSVSLTIKKNFNSIMGHWKNLGKEKQKKIIKMVKNNESNSDLGSITLQSGTTLDIDIIMKMIEKDRGKQRSVLKDIDGPVCFSYGRIVQLWQVFAREEMVGETKEALWESVQFGSNNFAIGNNIRYRHDH